MAVRDIVQAAAGVGGAEAAYIEDVFSTHIYTGTGSARSITNGIDLDGEGGLVWIKERNNIDDNLLFDTVRGATKRLITNGSNAEGTDVDELTAFNSDGFSLGADTQVNANANTYVSWTFRKAPKFFDVVTYTGTGVARTVSHNLGSVPGCIIVKRTNTTSGWFVYHRGTAADPETDYLTLNTDSALNDSNQYWNDTAPTDSVFTVGTNAFVNASGSTYVAYLFAHDAGGFGDDGTENVISCGSYTGNGSTTGPVIDLGYEPQWLLVKRFDATANWNLVDNIRGFFVAVSSAELNPNLDAAESTGIVSPTTTGFEPNTTATDYNASGGTYIYIAIRRGPMKTPESGTEVFTPITKTADAPTATLAEIGFQFDVVFNDPVAGPYGSDASYANRFSSSLIGLGSTTSQALVTSSTAVEASYAYTKWDGATFSVGGGWGATSKFLWYFFKRAPGFFDVVCFKPTSDANYRISHNLGVAPELVIFKPRDLPQGWSIYSSALGRSQYMFLNTTAASASFTDVWGTSDPTSTDIGANTTIGGWQWGISGGYNISAYLFATVAGVSKVGSYTGTGTTHAIDCGFSSGARFIMIKRTDSTSDWYVWDSARGIVSGAEPYIRINLPNAEVTGNDYIDPSAAGFEISSTAPAAINGSGGNFIFLAIA